MAEEVAEKICHKNTTTCFRSGNINKTSRQKNRKKYAYLHKMAGPTKSKAKANNPNNMNSNLLLPISSSLRNWSLSQQHAAATCWVDTDAADVTIEGKSHKIYREKLLPNTPKKHKKKIKIQKYNSFIYEIFSNKQLTPFCNLTLYDILRGKIKLRHSARRKQEVSYSVKRANGNHWIASNVISHIEHLLYLFCQG